MFESTTRIAALTRRMMRASRFAVPAALLAVLWATAFPAEETPDFSGVWLPTSPRAAHGANRPPLTARAKADQDGFNPLDDPVLRCVPPGFPRDGFIIYPFEITQTPKMFIFIYEAFGMVRRIYMDDRQVPDYLPPTMMGFSVGRWENGELVIDTTHFAPRLMGGGIQQYGDMSVVERYRLVDDGKGLQLALTITAPQTFTEPWTRNYTWDRDPDGMIFEYTCDPKDSRF